LNKSIAQQVTYQDDSLDLNSSISDVTSLSSIDTQSYSISDDLKNQTSDMNSNSDTDINGTREPFTVQNTSESFYGTSLLTNPLCWLIILILLLIIVRRIKS